MSETNNNEMIYDRIEHIVNDTIDDAELDAMLAQWADAEVALPDGFHETVMHRLRAEQIVQAPQQKADKVVSLSQWFQNKKTWVSAVAAAALVLCCLPVLQNYQDNLAGVVHNGTAQVYDMKNRSITQENAAEPQIMTTSLMDTEDAVTPAYDTNATMAKSAAAETAVFDYVKAESKTAMTPEKELALAQDNLAELEAHISALDDSAESQALREELETKIAELEEQIRQLEEIIAENNADGE